MKYKRSEYPKFSSRQECETHPLVLEELRGTPESVKKKDLILDLRIPILWHETNESDIVDYQTLHEKGDELFGSVNAVMALRSIAKAGNRRAWLPIEACTPESRQRARLEFQTGRDYSYAENNSRKVGIAELSPAEFINLVKQAKEEGDGEYAFYCVEIKAVETYRKLGIAQSRAHALGRLDFYRDRIFKDDAPVLKWHCLISNISGKDEARLLEKYVEKTFGDLCRRWPKNPNLRFGFEQFQDHQRLRDVAKELRQLSDRDLPEKYLKHFA